ncbi:MAG: hypothetical protein JSV65_08865 [Armatimonadota bacterium]|nr:MAG: hypothetical protein JSV65_08865 [Armatimonadota bacterium]
MQVPIMNMTPLTWPSSFVPPPPELIPLPPSPEKRSWLRKLFELFPFRLISYGPEYCRAVDYIEKQLLARERPDPSRWGDGLLRVDIGQRVCELIKEAYNWPNDHFLPDDRLSVVFLRPWDYDMLTVETALALEEDFNISEDDAMTMIWTVKTLGEMVDRLIAHLQRESNRC